MFSYEEELTVKKSDDAKLVIIGAATELIMHSNGDINEITTRMIAEKAGVAVGMINYHFQTKENLVEVCVQKIINGVTDNFRPQLKPDMPSGQRVITVVKMVADFLMEHQAISRISILADYRQPAPDDNTMKTVKGFSAVLAKGGGELGRKQQFAVFALTSLLQSAFLRKDLTAGLCGYDFNQKEERDALIDMMADQLGVGGEEYE